MKRCAYNMKCTSRFHLFKIDHLGLKTGLRSQNRNRSEPYSFGDSGTGTVFGIRFRFQVQGNLAKHSRKFIKSLIISFHVGVGIGTGTGTAVQVQVKVQVQV
jgi:hypothetical protein